MLGLLISACGPDTAETASPRPDRPEVAPGDFVLLPCSAGTERPCAYVMAGGKPLMFGAPAGAAKPFDWDELAGLDMLMFFSLHPMDVAGVDEIRHAGWRGGREATLPVTGPEGTGVFVERLNGAFEQSDAISFVADGAPPGGFVAALLSPGSEVRDEKLVYDSGDLKVRTVAGRAPGLTYRIGYRDIDEIWHEVVLAPCNSDAEPGPGTYPLDPDNRMRIGCDSGEGIDRTWPLQAPVFVVKSDP